MRIDLTCPAEIFRTALPTEEVPAAALTLFNLSGRIIASVEVCLRMLDAKDRETDRLAYRARSLNGRPHSTFLMTVPCSPDKSLRSIEATIEKVWFSDNEVWRRDPVNETEYTPNALPVSPALTRLRYAAGETAVGWPSRQEGLWVCICGRPNPAEADACARCSRLRDEVFAAFSPEAVEAGINLRERQLDLNSRSLREDTIRLQRIREEEYNRRKARNSRRLRLALSLFLCLLLCGGMLFFGVPGLRLLAGKKALSDGETGKAQAIFASLGSFGSAPRLLEECEWLTADELAKEADSPDALAEASARLRKISGREEAAEKANEIDLVRARLLLSLGRQQEALAALHAVPEDTAGREELVGEIRLAEARGMIDQGKYEEARSLLLEMSSVPEAADLAAECVYRPALALMEAEDWDGAIEAFSRIPEYSDSREMTLRCHYHKATELEASGDPAAAVQEYLMAGNTLDAKKRMAALTLSMADEQLALGNLKDAHTLYASLPDNREAVEKDMTCRLILAKEAADDREFTRALELLEGVPDDYQNAGTLRASASWEKARIAAQQEDWTLVADLLRPLNRQALRSKYRNIESLYLEACEKAGIEAYPATPEPESGTPEATPAPADEGEAPVAAPSVLPDSPFLVTEDEP